MIEIRNAKTLDGKRISLDIPSSKGQTIDASHLTLFPGLIDPHVHFRTPGLEHKENWTTAAKAAISGGITTVLDMPNTVPACITKERLHEKKALIDKQLKEVGIPLRYGLYLGADKKHFQEIYRCKQEIAGLKVFMGSSTGDLLMDDDSSLHAAFSLAASLGVVLSVHAEDEELIKERKALFASETHPRVHSKIRNNEVALLATKKALELAKIYKTRLYLLHIGTKEEVVEIEKAKKERVEVFAETTPHHLFLSVDDYETFGTKVQMNPPLRTKADQEALWEAIRKGVIDTIGSDHAPHTLEEKSQPYGKAPSGIPGVETTFPLLLDAHHRGMLPLSDVVRLMRKGPEEVFRLPPNDDIVLVDMQLKKRIENKNLQTKCGWSPYEGRTLQGWPVYTICRGEVYACN